MGEWMNFFLFVKGGKVMDFYDEWVIGIVFYLYYRCIFIVVRGWFVD